MKLWLVPVYALLGFVAIVALLPQSSWIPKTELDAIAGRWHYTEQMSSDTGWRYVRPVIPGLTDEDPDPAPDATFLRLVSPNRFNESREDHDRRIRALFQVCKAKNRPDYWAQYVRITSFFGMMRNPEEVRKAKFDASRHANQVLLDQACAYAEKVDPDNAFFPIIHAGALMGLGDAKGARAAFLKASTLPLYKDYVTLEPDLRYKYVLNRFGYRGRQLQATMLTEILLPHLSAIRSVTRYYSQEKGTEGQVAAVRIARLLLDQDQTLVGLYTGRAIFFQALQGEETLNYERLPNFPEVLQLARDLEVKAKTDTIMPMARLVNALSPQLDIHKWPDAEGVEVVLNLRPAYSGWAFLSVLLLPAAVGFAWLKARSSIFAAASPYLIWLLAFGGEPMFGSWCSGMTMYGAAALLFFPALIPKLRRWVDFAAIILTMWCALPAAGAPPLFIPVILFAASLWLERKGKVVPSGVTGAFVGMACAIGAAVWVAVSVQTDAANGSVFGVLATVGAFSAIPVRPSPRWAPIAGVAAMLLGLVYGATVYHDLAQDRLVAAVCGEMLNEANGVRAAAQERLSAATSQNLLN